ncbi:hypothetical protein Cgig2_019508 [Carnegiea gigantea]|uniref:Pre-mRNA-processing protein 40A n=1 Tax=Carnegiea gigantea TaxID=171969 RepID=A0A9Q1KPW3_9CARY|nr:hypothetical protein Cgig2_019508 [Carnegiea gigantea]
MSTILRISLNISDIKKKPEVVSGLLLTTKMANNPQFAGGPGPGVEMGCDSVPEAWKLMEKEVVQKLEPFHPPMVGTVPPPQNIPPPMPTQYGAAAYKYISLQFRPVAPVHLSQQFAPSVPQQYQPLGPGIAATNPGMPAPQTQQMQFAQPMQQAPTRPAPPGHLPSMSQSVALPNVQLNRTMSAGMPQPVQNLQNSSSFVPASGAPGGPLASAYAAVDSQSQHVEHSSDWIEHNKNGRRYYYNKKTRQSTWEKPLELMTPLERADATTDWKEYTSPDGRKYYYNKVTKQSKWIIPEELKQAREQAERASCVTEVAGSANTSVAAALSDVKIPSNADAKSSTPVVHSSPVSVTPVGVVATTPARPSPGSNDSNASQANESADSARSIMGQGAEEANKSADTAGKTNVTASDEKAIEHETVTYANKQEAKDAFKALLESVHVESDWTWEQTMRLIINDKRYAALRSLGERKQAFNEYLNQKKKQEAEERRARNKKAREDFRKMLEECSELTSTTRWGFEPFLFPSCAWSFFGNRKAVKIFSDDERFKAIERTRDREDMFEEYLAELEKKELEKAEDDRQRNIIDYRKFLESCDFIKANSQWRKVKDRLEADERCSRLETIDRLKIFQEYVGDLEKEEEEQRRIQKNPEIQFILSLAISSAHMNAISFPSPAQNTVILCGDTLDTKNLGIHFLKEAKQLISLQYHSLLQLKNNVITAVSFPSPTQNNEEVRKSERRNRDEFRKLLDGHVADGTLTAKTKWFDYHAKVKDLPAYVAISSNTSGSTPKELFEDVVEELKKQYQEDRTRIKDAVKSEKVALSSSWTLEEFKAAIANEISSTEVSEHNLKIVFDELLERAREKEEKEAKRRKRLGDEFFNMLCSLKVDVTGDSKWEDCLPLFEAREEFRSIGDEAFAKQIFEEYLTQLREKEKERDRKRKEEKAKKEKDKERDKRSKDRREKDRRHDRSRGKERSEKDEGDDEPDFNEISASSENRKSVKDKDRKHRKRHHDEEDDASLDKSGKDHSRSSHRHSSERKKSRQMEQHGDLSESDDESRHKKHKREHRNGSRRRSENEELEDGELGGKLVSKAIGACNQEGDHYF